eukprot:gnl/MRDRNA2_/MRDRNA2_85257_c0_seq1.p1 gnl/MRDRNA2_/MRDRNA2_85257_c0~~gnl/MRDRNA2_/MRDRNA2_85257_c0_seq1.p1  ORF type:complete len:473 (+),score=91.10 gnl/MRDRNA2_/MRDRNA2_85257_c0_seq1:121-1539(+)
MSTSETSVQKAIRKLKQMSSGNGITDDDGRGSKKNQKAANVGYKSAEAAEKSRQVALIRTREHLVLDLQQYQKTYRMQNGRDTILPVVYFNDLLLARDLYKIHFSKTLDEFLDPGNVTEIQDNVVAILDALDDDARINGKLAVLYKNEAILKDVVNLLIFSRHYPPRSEILYLERLEESVFSQTLGLLRENIVKGRTPELVMSLDIFLEYSVNLVAGKTVVKLPELSLILTQVWKHIDIDGDGTLSVDESRELTRLLMSRPALGKLMLCMVLNDAANSFSCTDEEDKKLLASLIPDVIRAAAQHAHSTAENLWRSMDKDGDGEVVEEEFCSLFDAGFWNSIAIPFSIKVAEEGKKKQAQLRLRQMEKKDPALEIWDDIKGRSCVMMASGNNAISSLLCDYDNGDKDEPQMTGAANDGRHQRSSQVPVPSEFAVDEMDHNMCSRPVRESEIIKPRENDKPLEGRACNGRCTIM